jgi:hypothetical protein
MVTATEVIVAPFGNPGCSLGTSAIEDAESKMKEDAGGAREGPGWAGEPRRGFAPFGFRPAFAERNRVGRQTTPADDSGSVRSTEEAVAATRGKTHACHKFKNWKVEPASEE